jgi:hypothetical protein
MSSNFEKRIFMPRGPLGPTTAMGDGKEKRIIRWYRREWEEFLAEVRAYKHEVGIAYHDLRLYLFEERQRCARCRKTHDALNRIADLTVRHPALRRYQRGMLSGFGVRRSAWAAGDCSFTASAIPTFTDFCVNPCAARTAARLHSDGDWYYQAGTGFGPSDGTWQGDCAVADYDTRHVKNSGDNSNYLTSGVNATWSAASTSKAVGYDQNGFGILSGNFDLECRDGTSLTVLFTDNFTMNAEVDAKN